MNRCHWVHMNNPIYVTYHDEEWGVPSYDDTYLFEMLLLESFQAGLSWECVLNKREYFREAFDNFQVEVVASYDDQKKLELKNNSLIIRNKRKIDASVINAKIFMEIQKEFGSFSNYIWHFTDGKIIYNQTGEVLTSSPLSDMVSRDLKMRGMKFVGTTIIYSYLQAIGVIYDHEKDCDFYRNQIK